MVLQIPRSVLFSAIVSLGQFSRIAHGQLSTLDPPGLNQASFKGRVERHGDPVKTVGAAPPLESWESWHRSAPACSSSSTLSDGAVYVTEHGEYVYEPMDCSLRRYTADEARR